MDKVKSYIIPVYSLGFDYIIILFIFIYKENMNLKKVLFKVFSLNSLWDRLYTNGV